MVPGYLCFSQQHNNIYIYTHIATRVPDMLQYKRLLETWVNIQNPDDFTFTKWKGKTVKPTPQSYCLVIKYGLLENLPGLVVWNIFYFPFSWECHHPNWWTHILYIFQMASYTTKQFHFVWFSQPEAFMYVLDVPRIFPWFSHVLQGKSCRRRSWANWMREVGPWEWGAGGFKENTAFTCIYHPVDIQKDVENHGNPS